MSDAGWAGRVLAWLGDPPYHERVWNHKHDASAPHHDEAKEEEEADGEIYGGTRPKDINAMHFLLTYAKYQSLKKGRLRQTYLSCTSDSKLIKLFVSRFSSDMSFVKQEHISCCE